MALFESVGLAAEYPDENAPGLGDFSRGEPSAITRLQEMLTAQQQQLDLALETRIRETDVQHDFALNDLMNGLSNGSIQGDPQVIVENNKRSNAQARNSILLEMARLKQDQGVQLEKISRFLATPSTVIEKQTPTNIGYRSELWLDPADNTVKQRVKQLSPEEEQTARLQEIAYHWDVPEEAVRAKSEQAAILDRQMRQAQQTALRQQRSDVRQELSDIRQAKEDARRDALRANEEAYKRSAIGQEGEIFKRTRSIPTPALEQLVERSGTDETSRLMAQHALKIRNSMDEIKTQQGLEDFYVRESQKIMKQVEEDFRLSPALVQVRHDPSLIKNNKINQEALLKYARQKAEQKAALLKKEREYIHLQDLDYDYGPNGQFTTELEGE